MKTKKLFHVVVFCILSIGYIGTIFFGAPAKTFSSVQDSSPRPSSYDSFIDAKSFVSLEQAIATSKYIYLEPGVYMLNNPVVIDSADSLFIHGGSRMDTILKPKDPTKPLFIVKNASLINFAGLYLFGERVTEYRVISFENNSPLQFEMHDCFLDAGVLDMKGPGYYRLQGTFVTNRGMNRAALVVDNPDADFYQ